MSCANQPVGGTQHSGQHGVSIAVGSACWCRLSGKSPSWVHFFWLNCVEGTQEKAWSLRPRKSKLATDYLNLLMTPQGKRQPVLGDRNHLIKKSREFLDRRKCPFSMKFIQTLYWVLFTSNRCLGVKHWVDRNLRKRGTARHVPRCIRVWCQCPASAVFTHL